MWSRTAILREHGLEINRPVKGKAPIGQNVNILDLVVGRGVEDADGSRLDKVVAYDELLLVGCEFDVVGSDDGLLRFGVVETDGVAEIGNVECRWDVSVFWSCWIMRGG